MEMLRIKCPSCGIVLEVTNSKNEKVKKIICPNCQKQLAITFGDMAAPVGSLYEGSIRYQLNEGGNAIPSIPSGLVELRVARLDDGTPKHIIRALTGEQKVKVNGQILMQDDEVVLQQGDELTIDAKSFCFDKPQPNISQTPEKNHQSEHVVSVPKPKKESKNAKPSWLLWTAVAVAAALVVVLLWPVKPVPQPQPVANDSNVEVVPQKEAEKRQEAEKPKAPSLKERKPSEEQPVSDGDNDFALEVEAAKGNTDAQYQLGMRWITSRNRSEVIKAVQYLQAASNSGNANAQYALGIVYGKGSSVISRNQDLSLQYMRQAAAKGHVKAQRYLEEKSE